MSLQIDINSLGDLIHAQGTEEDRRAWARYRAHVDDLRRRLDVAAETLRLTGGAIEASLIEAGDIDQEHGPVERALLIQFDSADELRRAMRGEPVVSRWSWERHPARAGGGAERGG